ncbi:MAG: sugar ABC transporter permease [Chloroflexi bacterium]|nr:sugar ABC transporter permease [Chloroflexota bacterium]
MSLRRRKALLGYLYILPWVIGFLVFILGPLLAAIYLSLTEFNIVRAPRFVGFANYEKILGRDDLFWTSLVNTLYFTIFSVPLGIIGSLLCAVLLNQKLKAQALFRTLFFIPSITPVVAATLVWIWIFQPDFGLLNYALSLAGITGPKWFGNPDWSKPALILMALWTIGGGRMLIFLAGLQGVPVEFYEAAVVDGATSWHKFWHITLPMISPAMFFNLVLAIISSFQVFTVAYVGTNGGPVDSTLFYVLYLFRRAFQFFEMGYAAALAWILFLILLVFTYLQFRSASRWVYYEGEREGKAW